MTPNDTQMDVLMRRYAKHATERGANTEHLDADELSAFAEGSLPAAARSQYASHLADCGDCRTLATQLVVASGSAAHAQVPASESAEQRSWWRKLTLVLSPSALRYAAFALVLLAVVGVAFVVWRQPRQRQANSDLVAKNEPHPNQTTALAPPANTESLTNTQSPASEQKALAQATPGAKVDAKPGEVTSVNPPPPPPKPVTETSASAPNSGLAATRPMEQPRTEATPSYAPQPGDYRIESRSREQQNIPGVTAGGPRRNETFEKYKTVDRVASVDIAKARDEDPGRATANQTKSETKQEEPDRARGQSNAPAAPRRSMDDKRAATRKADAAESEKDGLAPQTRSVGGRKFQRQGNAWVDVKFKSSMSVKNVTRASDDFASLDSGLRSIAQQLGGEVVVVWKGKAYRFR